MRATARRLEGGGEQGTGSQDTGGREPTHEDGGTA